MSKRMSLPIRSLGAETGIPAIAELSSWIADHRGKEIDLTRFRILQSLLFQRQYGISTPCAGGMFLRDRIVSSLTGLTGDRVTDDPWIDDGVLAADARVVAEEARGAWCALPAPDNLGIVDDYFRDPDEWSDAICGVYRSMMRSMRDSGIAGNVLLCKKTEDAEVASLASNKVLFFQQDPDRTSLAILMEYQKEVVAGPGQLALVFDLADEYSFRNLCIIDPDPESISLALTHLDFDRLKVGGYCTNDCEDYWKNLARSASYESVL